MAVSTCSPVGPSSDFPDFPDFPSLLYRGITEAGMVSSCEGRRIPVQAQHLELDLAGLMQELRQGAMVVICDAPGSGKTTVPLPWQGVGPEATESW